MSKVKWLALVAAVAAMGLMVGCEDDDDDAREIARKKRVAAGLEPADAEDRKRPRKAVARKAAPGARKPRA